MSLQVVWRRPCEGVAMVSAQFMCHRTARLQRLERISGVLSFADTSNEELYTRP